MKAEMGKNLSAVGGRQLKDKKAPARWPGLEERQYSGKAVSSQYSCVRSAPGPSPADKVPPRRDLSGLEAIEDLVGPEALETMQRLVEHAELVGIDAADLLDRAHVFLIEGVDDVAHLAALVGELDAHRAPIDARALMIEEPHLDELLEIVRNVRAEIVAASTQLAGSELLVADI